MKGGVQAQDYILVYCVVENKFLMCIDWRLWRWVCHHTAGGWSLFVWLWRGVEWHHPAHGATSGDLPWCHHILLHCFGTEWNWRGGERREDGYCKWCLNFVVISYRKYIVIHCSFAYKVDSLISCTVINSSVSPLTNQISQPWSCDMWQ